MNHPFRVFARTECQRFHSRQLWGTIKRSEGKWFEQREGLRRDRFEATLKTAVVGISVRTATKYRPSRKCESRLPILISTGQLLLKIIGSAGKRHYSSEQIYLLRLRSFDAHSKRTDAFRYQTAIWVIYGFKTQVGWSFMSIYWAWWGHLGKILPSWA
jgi:hypothetical protein